MRFRYLFIILVSLNARAEENFRSLTSADFQELAQQAAKSLVVCVQGKSPVQIMPTSNHTSESLDPAELKRTFTAEFNKIKIGVYDGSAVKIYTKIASRTGESKGNFQITYDLQATVTEGKNNLCEVTTEITKSSTLK